MKITEIGRFLNETPRKTNKKAPQALFNSFSREIRNNINTPVLIEFRGVVPSFC